MVAHDFACGRRPHADPDRRRADRRARRAGLRPRGELLRADVSFHAVVPGTGSFRERAGAAETAGQLRLWLGDADPLELLDSSVEPVVDKLRLSYRFAAFEDGQWHVVEQQAYAVVGERGIEKLDLLCCGFRPVSQRPATP